MPSVLQRKGSLFSGMSRSEEARSYLLLLLIPFLLCLILYIAVHFVIRSEIRQHAEQTATQFYLQSSSMLREMDQFGEAAANDARMIDAMTNNDADLDPLALCDSLREAVSRNPFIEHVYIVNDRSAHIYSDEGYFSAKSLDSILSRIGIDAASQGSCSALSEQEFQRLSVSSFTPYCFLPIVSPRGETLGTAIVTMNMTSFLRNFYALDASLCCVFRDDFFISSSLSMARGRDFDWTNTAAVAELVGEPVTCVYKAADDFTYLVAVSNSEYNKPLNVILICFFLYAAAVLAASFVSLRRFAVKRQGEITALIDALPDYSGEAAYSAVIPAVKKSLEEYRLQQESAGHQIQERNLRYLLYGHNPSNVNDDFITAAGIPKPFDRSYYVANFYLRDAAASPAFDFGRWHENRSLAQLTLRSALTGLLEQGMGMTACADIDSFVVLFWSEDDPGLFQRVYDVCDKAVDLLLDNYNAAVQVMLSDRITDIAELPAAFSSTRDMNEFARSTDSSQHILCHEELLGRQEATVAVDFVRQEQILANTLLAQKYSQIPSLVRSILDKCVTPLKKDFDLARSRLRTIANMLAEAILSDPKNDLPADRIIQSFRQVGSVSELNAVTEEYFGRLTALTEEAADENELVRRACEYIQENTSDHNLNVSAICEFVDVSPQRLTRMFQARFDMTIAEYMNTRRIEQAKRLLRENPKMSVAQIAETVGYNNTPSLTRNFRKLEGLTPSEYRELQL